MKTKLTELYSLSIPLFIPSAKFYRAVGGLGVDRTMVSIPYCHTDPKLEEKMRPELGNMSSHLYSPNVDFKEGPEHEMYWLQFADFNDWPHIQYFYSYKHLADRDLAETTNTRPDAHSSGDARRIRIQGAKSLAKLV